MSYFSLEASNKVWDWIEANPGKTRKDFEKAFCAPIPDPSTVVVIGYCYGENNPYFLCDIWMHKRDYQLLINEKVASDELRRYIGYGSFEKFVEDSYFLTGDQEEMRKYIDGYDMELGKYHWTLKCEIQKIKKKLIEPATRKIQNWWMEILLNPHHPVGKRWLAKKAEKVCDF